MGRCGRGDSSRQRHAVGQERTWPFKPTTYSNDRRQTGKPGHFIRTMVARGGRRERTCPAGHRARRCLLPREVDRCCRKTSAAAGDYVYRRRFVGIKYFCCIPAKRTNELIQLMMAKMMMMTTFRGSCRACPSRISRWMVLEDPKTFGLNIAPAGILASI